VRELQAEGKPVVSVYPTGVYGPEDPGFGAPLKGLRDRLRYAFLMAAGGFGCVDVRDLALVLAAALEAGRGPRRYMAGGHFMTWPEEADLVEEIVGRRVRRLPAPRLLLLIVGRLVDLLQRLVPSFDYPLTHEAALIITDFVPCDQIPWSLFGLSMAGYNVLASLALGLASLWAARKPMESAA